MNKSDNPDLPHRKRSPRALALLWLGRLGIGFTLLLVGGRLALPLVPLPRALFDRPAPNLVLLDRHGRPLREVRDASFSRPALPGQIPQSLREATLAAEDARFQRHHGMDWRASLRAFASLVRHRRIVSGGSTITQQLIKLAQPRPRTFRTKLVEAVQALRLEQVWDKQRILTEYLNRVDYGNLNVGCAAAAQFYFGKPLRDLSAAESAFLAALPQAPSRLNPLKHFAGAQKRQQWILSRMQQIGFLTPAERNRASAEPLQLGGAGRVFRAPHFVEMVLDGLDDVGVLPNQSQTLRTSLDLELNDFVERALRRQIEQLHAQHARNAAAVVLDNRTGDLLALVGSPDYFSTFGGQVNGAWAARSAGSTLKPFTYLLAFEHGATPATVVADIPTEFATATGLFAPANYDHRCHGPMRYRLALANSLNISAVKVLASVGGAAPLQQRLQACGLTTLKAPAEFYGLGLTLGNADVRLLELVNAYACLARLGEAGPYRLLLPDHGDEPPSRNHVFDPGAAWLIADILSDPAARALTFGSESSLRFDFPVACKTGTSSDFRDNWALGYSPEFTVGVWVGNCDGTPMERVSGVSGAAPILHEVFDHLHQRCGTSWYQRPSNIVEQSVHRITGRLLARSHPEAVAEKFIARTLPARERAEDYDSAGRVRLPAEYRAWFASGDNWLAGQAVVEAANASQPLRLVTPLPGTVFFVDPDLPASSRRIPLKAEGGTNLIWSSDSLECSVSDRGPSARMTAGEHRLSVFCADTGERLATWVVVKEL